MCLLTFRLNLLWDAKLQNHTSWLSLYTHCLWTFVVRDSDTQTFVRVLSLPKALRPIPIFPLALSTHCLWTFILRDSDTLPFVTAKFTQSAPSHSYSSFGFTPRGLGFHELFVLAVYISPRSSVSFSSFICCSDIWYLNITLVIFIVIFSPTIRSSLEFTGHSL